MLGIAEGYDRLAQGGEARIAAGGIRSAEDRVN
jgi:hypothetical protein